MVDSTRATESEFVNVDLVRDSKSKKLVITGEGEYRKTEFDNERLTLPVEIDGKQKLWSPNMDTAKNIKVVCGVDTKYWVGQKIGLQVIKKNGKDCILGIPLAN